MIPYHQWHKSKKIEVLDDKIVVPVAAGRALKFARGEAALAHHPLAPEKTGKKRGREGGRERGREGGRGREREMKCLETPVLLIVPYTFAHLR